MRFEGQGLSLDCGVHNIDSKVGAVRQICRGQAKGVQTISAAACMDEIGLWCDLALRCCAKVKASLS